MDTVTLPLQDPGRSMAGALAMAAASVAASVAVGVSDAALVPGLAGGEVMAGADISLGQADRMDPLMGPPTPALMP